MSDQMWTRSIACKCNGPLFESQRRYCQRQLTAHLERLPPERSVRGIISRQESCGMGQLRWYATITDERTAGHPQKESVEQGNAHRPHCHEHECNCAGVRILV
eukprot:5265786-Prymnesium_polylepis.1